MSSTREKKMMKRSDFGQKLLDDLQLRKERLAASQSSSNANCVPSVSDKIAYSDRGFKGTVEIKTKGRNSQGLRSSSIISFLHQVGRKSMGHEASRKGNQLPMVHIHINEVSEGTQKLNQIINACSNGLGFGNGRYSIEQGKELMQGATDLEQSLSMLINIQETSDYVYMSQKYNRIRLLDDYSEDTDDDDDDSIVEEVKRADTNMRLSARDYPKYDNLNYTKHLRGSSHRRSVTCDEAGLSSFAIENKESRSSRSETGRIPNVIAKLMGLEECAEDEDIKRKKQRQSVKTETESHESMSKVMRANKVTTLDNLASQKAQTLKNINHEKSHLESYTRDNIKNQKNTWEKGMGKNINGRAIPKGGIKEDKMYRPNASQTEKRHMKEQNSQACLSLESREARGKEKGYSQKEKFPGQRQKANISTTNHSQSPLNSVGVNKKLLQAKLHRCSYGKHKSKPKDEYLNQKSFASEPNSEIELNESDSQLGRQKHVRKEHQRDTNQLRGIADDQIKVKDDSVLLMLITRRNGDNIREEAQSRAFIDDSQETVLGGNVNTLSQAVPKSLNGIRGVIETNSPEQEQPQNPPTREITLSKHEIHLKKIILTSQLFLDTAETFFKLGISLSIFHTSENDYTHHDNNLMLDCGYELMKRKGQLKELSIHPFVKVPVSSFEVKSIDDLVKQLSKEFEKLRSYSRELCTELVVEDYLPKIIERDVQYKDPVLNSMWDMGWSDSMLNFMERDDIIRDIERYVFNVLVEEVIRDLIRI